MLALIQHRAARLAALTAPDGWLNLVARIPIGTGAQTVGTDGDIRLPSGPGSLGRLIPQGTGYGFETPTGMWPFVARPDTPPQLTVPPFLLEIHSVDGQHALRVRDLTLPRAVSLHYFPTNPDWIIRARWQALNAPQLQTIDQKGAGPTTVSLTHTASFTHAGQPATLLATHWKGAKPMFVIRDGTSGHGSYAASRFLTGEDATETEITLDFNRAFTPPCGFTEHAICPLPPRENRLSFRIEAGELAP